MSTAPVRSETRTSITSVAVAFAAAVRASGAERARDATAKDKEEEEEEEEAEEGGGEERAPFSSPGAETGHSASAAPAASAASHRAAAGAMVLPRTTCARSQEAVSGRSSSASKRAWPAEGGRAAAGEE